MITDEFLLQPNIYSTQGKKTLLGLLEEHWIENVTPGVGDIYILSGFGNYNGGVRFYDIFKNHIKRGGRVFAMFAGSTSQKLTSKQLVEKLLDCGASVSVLNRKRIMHAKLFGYKNSNQQTLIVTSGNFTGPGMTQNVEAAIGLSPERVKEVGFDWENFYGAYHSQDWDLYTPVIPINTAAPEWKLLYDEDQRISSKIEEIEANTMLLMLGHADTVRINAEPGTPESKGSQYFWLSKDAFDFFPALTIPNARGEKPTYSALVKIKYLDLDNLEDESRVTFEAGNNVDFRLGTGPLRYTKLAQEGDIAAITRTANAEYDLKIYKQSSEDFKKLEKYMVTFIGHRGKKYGYIPNETFDQTIKTP
ncbi:restriction endonuclease [Candidatus Daviesbacteria bacterium]|nr:restriction endonuclease [Candidatus Daviesbacteria bacterium]MBI4038851.1 restriction endonuclease [Candidatus Daviesbacteria bacterium]